jgi:galactose-1-phosphate uridylyltransferase
MEDMAAFLEEAPGYTVCSNSDVEGAGSSILEHHHFQVFKGLKLPAMTAEAKPIFRARDIRAEYLDFPCASLRLSSGERDRLVRTAAEIMNTWKGGSAGNTGNLIAWRECREKGGEWNMIIFFRNPAFQIPRELRRFKSEGIGIIEAAGAAILPVPSGPDAEELHGEIRKNGGRIIRGILEGINPVSADEEPALWESIIGTIGKEERS